MLHDDEMMRWAIHTTNKSSSLERIDRLASRLIEYLDYVTVQYFWHIGSNVDKYDEEKKREFLIDFIEYREYLILI